MIRRCPEILAVTLALTLVTVAAAGVADAGLSSSPGVGCTVDVGVRVTVRVEDGVIRGSVVVPGLSVWFGSTGELAGWLEPSAVEVLNVSIDASSAVGLAIPILNAVAGMAAARAGRL